MKYELGNVHLLNINKYFQVGLKRDWEGLGSK